MVRNLRFDMAEFTMQSLAISYGGFHAENSQTGSLKTKPSLGVIQSDSTANTTGQAEVSSASFQGNTKREEAEAPRNSTA